MGSNLCQKKKPKEDKTYFKPVIIKNKNSTQEDQINEEMFTLDFQNETGITFMQQQARFCSSDSVLHLKNRISRDYNLNLLHYAILTTVLVKSEYVEYELQDDSLKIETLSSRKLIIRKHKASTGIRGFTRSRPKQNKEYLETWLSKITESDHEYSSHLKINNLASIHESDEERVELNPIYRSINKELSIHTLNNEQKSGRKVSLDKSKHSNYQMDFKRNSFLNINSNGNIGEDLNIKSKINRNNINVFQSNFNNNLTITDNDENINYLNNKDNNKDSIIYDENENNYGDMYENCSIKEILCIKPNNNINDVSKNMNKINPEIITLSNTSPNRYLQEYSLIPEVFNKSEFKSAYVERVVLPSSSNSEPPLSNSSSERQLYILKLKGEDNKSKVKVYRSLEALKSRVQELVRYNEQYAETEWHSDRDKEFNEEWEAKQPSDNSLISSWMMSSEGDESLDMDLMWEGTEVVKKASESLKLSYNYYRV